MKYTHTRLLREVLWKLKPALSWRTWPAGRKNIAQQILTRDDQRQEM